MKFIVVENYDEMSKVAAEYILAAVKDNPALTLGLATGSTPIGMYREIIAAYERGEVDFAKAKSFNLDEYYPIAKANEQSYDYFMRKHLFSHVNMKEENIHLPNGEAADANVEAAEYEKLIDAIGGADIQVLGIGRNGHIGFNEPDSFLVPDTHLTDLTPSTIEANSRFFASEDDVPKHAMTMGIGTILRSKKIIILINGKNKHAALMEMLKGDITTKCPASFLVLHSDVTVLCDEEAYNG